MLPAIELGKWSNISPILIDFIAFSFRFLSYTNTLILCVAEGANFRLVFFFNSSISKCF